MRGGNLQQLGLDDPRWLNLVERTGTLAFHRPEWAQLLADCYGYRPLALALARHDGELHAGLPILEVRRLRRTKWISLPFTDFSPPLAMTPPSRAALVASLHALVESGDIPALEVRADIARSSRHSAVMHTLPLNADPDSVLATFKKSQVRQRITKAERAGVVVSHAESEEDLTRTFFELHVDTRRRLGVPVQPRRFFELVWRRLVEPGFGFSLIARSKARPIAAAVFLAWGETVTYKYGASDPGAWNLRPNNLMLWHAIRWGCKNGYRTFDFGRTDLTNQGLREFKLGWGTTEYPLPYTFLGAGSAQKQAASPIGGAAAAIIRRSPRFVCRAAGELLYRYAA